MRGNGGERLQLAHLSEMDGVGWLAAARMGIYNAEKRRRFATQDSYLGEVEPPVG